MIDTAEELGIPQNTFYTWTAEKRSLMQKQVNQAIAIDLLNMNLTHQQIAEQNGYTSDKKIQRFKSEMVDKITNVVKMSTEELQEADLDFLIEYKEFIENNLLLYNIWNIPKGDNRFTVDRGSTVLPLKSTSEI